MNIPAPAFLGPCPTIALGAPLGWLGAPILDLTGSRHPVILHRLGTPAEREQIGPRELGEQTYAALEKLQLAQPWGFGGILRDTEDAALFAHGGATWFTLDLASKIEPGANAMSLDELDAAIVALEDEGCFPLDWHDAYFQPGRVFHGAPDFAFSDESLARAAVKFGRALAHAEQLKNTLTIAGGGLVPDVEYSFDAPGPATTPEEFIFLCAELASRRLLSGAATRLRPSFGPCYEPGADLPDFSEPPRLLRLPSLCPPPIILSAPLRLARALGWESAHWDATEESLLAFFTHLANHHPAFFRQWLAVAHEIFPVARCGKNITSTEDDLHYLPTSADPDLAATFLGAKQGRQLLLATWDEVRAALGPQARALLATSAP